MNALLDSRIEVFSTCPQSRDAASGNAYLRDVIDVARWSEEAGCRGMLVYSDNGLVDPWLVSQVVLQNTERLCPLVAVQPVYMHPYATAKMVASFACLHDRRIYLNMVAGGFRNDLVALNDLTPHDERYDRVVEYTLVVKQLLSTAGPVTYKGKYYIVNNLKMTPPLPPGLFPGIFISGSSEAGMAAAATIGATAVKYPKPPDQEAPSDGGNCDMGIRVGVIARSDGEEARRIARERFPTDRRGQLKHQLAMKVSDSAWHKQLSDLGEQPPTPDNPYWLGPFLYYKTFCPYLVGSYGRVAEELARYVALGFRKFILDIPPSQEELHHTGIVFAMALQRQS